MGLLGGIAPADLVCVTTVWIFGLLEKQIRFAIFRWQLFWIWKLQLWQKFLTSVARCYSETFGCSILNRFHSQHSQ